jgi:hypothetical protein
MKKFINLVLNFILCAAVFAQPKGAEKSMDTSTFPVKRVVIFSSGIAFFEHSLSVSGTGELQLTFKAEDVNDALKSLIINDPENGKSGGAAPGVTYPSEQTLYRTLQSLSVDLSGDPSLADILNGLRGTEIELAPPLSLKGRIIGTEKRGGGKDSPEETWLSLLTGEGIRGINIEQISTFAFNDSEITGDLNRALDLIKVSRNTRHRNLKIKFPDSGDRIISVSYVIPAPVWKVSYRLDLSGVEVQTINTNTGKAHFQGWAIVDNDSDMDWEDVSLSLVAGRPVSFKQNLYPPYYLERPTLPLAIAGIARAETYDTGMRNRLMKESAVESMAMVKPMVEEMDYYEETSVPAASSSWDRADTAVQSGAGDQFDFTLNKPVSLDRQMSAMLPLTDGGIEAEKLIILSGARALNAGIHPSLGAELTNTTGIRLPAGPVTVYDKGPAGSVYSGDALLDFLNDGEKRLISYGEDLSVTASAALKTDLSISAVAVNSGLMTITRKQGFQRTYSIKNNASENKLLIIEHPITNEANLVSPADYSEKTPAAYRFRRIIPAKGESVFTVREETPRYERVTLAQLTIETLLSYASSREIGGEVRSVFARTAELKQNADKAADDEADILKDQNYKIEEQNRIRRNLEAAGNTSVQGQEYLKRLSAADTEIDALAEALKNAELNTKKAKETYEAYLLSISF